MSKDYKKELNEMLHLINYGKENNQSCPNQESNFEYTQVGANGKTYGIVKEGTKYYIKVAPKKHTQLLKEDFDYIGGFLNRKSYDSYTKASNALNLELIHVNDNMGNKTPIKSQYNINESAEWKTADTKAVRSELNRFHQLVENVDNLLNENVHYINENDKTFSEKPTKFPKETKAQGGKEQPLGIKDKKWMKTDSKIDAAKNYEKFGVKGNSPSGKYNAAVGVDDIDLERGNPYQENSKTSKEQGKNIFEKRSNQSLAWKHKRAFVHDDCDLDLTHGTEIGDTAPYIDNVNENFCVNDCDNGVPSEGSTGDAKAHTNPYCWRKNDLKQDEIIYEMVINDDDEYGNDDEINIDAIDFAEKHPSFEVDNDEFDDDFEEDYLIDDSDEYDVNDILKDIPDTDRPYYNNTEDFELNENTLNVFGKHPAYRKEIMTLPKTGDDSQWGRDWNDASTKGNKPYGSQIGHAGDPFTEKVDQITNIIVNAITKKKS